MFIDKPILKTEAAQRERAEKQRSEREQKVSIQHSGVTGHSQKSNRSSNVAGRNFASGQAANTINSSRSGKVPDNQGTRKLSQNALQELDQSLEQNGENKVAKYIQSQQRNGALVSNQNSHQNRFADQGSNHRNESNYHSRGSSTGPAQQQHQQAKMSTENQEQQRQFIQQFGKQKGQQYYGAIRELEEFLDPNVLNDVAFQMNDKTYDEINSNEGMINQKLVSNQHSVSNSGVGMGVAGDSNDRSRTRQRSTNKSANYTNPSVHLPEANESKKAYESSNNEYTRTFDNKYGQGSQSASHEQQQFDKAHGGQYDENQYHSNQYPQYQGPLASGFRQKKFTPGKGRESKPKSKGVKSRKLQSQGENDMLLMNIRMNMHTQNAQRDSEKHINKNSQPQSPVMAHAYGYNDSVGELRNQQQMFGNSLESSERKGGKKSPFVSNQVNPGNYNNFSQDINQLIFDPQSQPQQNSKKAPLRSYYQQNEGFDGYSGMIDKSFFNNQNAAPSIFNDKRQSSKTDNFRNSAATAERVKRHKSVAHRTKFATREGLRNQKIDALPSIKQNSNIQMGIYQNSSSTNIFKKNKNQYNNQYANMNVTQNFDKSNYQLRDNSRLSGKSGPKTGYTSKGVITPSTKEKRKAYLESPEAPVQHFQADPGMGGKQKFAKGVSGNYQGAQEAMRVPRDFKESPLKKNKGLGSMQHQQNGKIILKKINHFFDNNKINKLYKNDFRKLNQQYTNQLAVQKAQHKLQSQMVGSQRNVILKSMNDSSQHHSRRAAEIQHLNDNRGPYFPGDGSTIFSKTDNDHNTQRTYQNDITMTSANENPLVQSGVGIRKDKSTKFKTKDNAALIDIVDQQPPGPGLKPKTPDDLNEVSRVKFANDETDYSQQHKKGRSDIQQYKEQQNIHNQSYQNPYNNQSIDGIQQERTVTEVGADIHHDSSMFNQHSEAQYDFQRKKKQAAAQRNQKRSQAPPEIPPVPISYQYSDQQYQSQIQAAQSKKDKNLLNYINKKMKAGDPRNMKFNQAQQVNAQQLIHKPSWQQYDGAGAYNSAADKGYELVQQKVKAQKQQQSKSRRRAQELNRNKSAPKRNVQKQQDIMRSMPNKQVMNRLVTRAYHQDRRAADDDQIVNIQVKSGKRAKAEKLQISASQQYFGNKGAQTTTFGMQRQRISTVNKGRRKNHASPSPANKSGNNPFLHATASGLNETLNSQRGGFLNAIQGSQSSIYRGNFHESRMYSRSRGSSRGVSRVSARRERMQSGNQSVKTFKTNCKSEIYRQLHHNKHNKKKTMVLDRNHLRELKKPENIRKTELFHPENFSYDHKKDLIEIYSQNSKLVYRKKSVDMDNPMRSSTAQSVYHNGQRYKFKLGDLNKYSATLRHRDINWKIHLSALGKKIPNVNERKKILIKGSHFNTLLKILKATDWSLTPVYHQFQRNGRWKHEDDKVYSDLELQYNISYLNKYLSADNVEEITQCEGRPIVKKYFNKTMHTLEVLMNQLNMMYYWEKVRLMFIDQEPTVAQLQKLMSRCVKLYTKIDSFIKIFKMIAKKERLDEQGVRDPVLGKRILVTIKLLQKENPVLPLTFNYKGTCIKEKIKRELRELGHSIADEEPRSPGFSKTGTNSDLRVLQQQSSGSKILAVSPGSKADINDNDSIQDSLIAGLT